MAKSIYRIAKAAGLHASFEKAFYGGHEVRKYSASKSDYDKIAEKVADGVDIEAFGVYSVLASSTRTDSTRDRFTRKVLNAMATHYKEGRTIVLGSHHRDTGIGKSFDATVSKAADGEYELTVKFYVPPGARTTTGANAKDMLDSGIYPRASIMAYWAEDPQVKVSGEGSDRVWEYPSAAGMQTIHLAILDMGANHDAVMKSLNSKSDTDTGGNLPPKNNENPKNPEMEKLPYNLIALKMSGELEVKPASVQALLEEADGEAVKLKNQITTLKSETETLRDDLQKFKDAANANLDSLRAEYEGLAKQLDDKADAALLKRKAGLFTLDTQDLLEAEVTAMKKQVSLLKQGTKTSAKPKAETQGLGSHL